MNREDYQTGLRKLPLNNPTLDDLTPLFPHLNKQTIEHLLNTTDQQHYIAAPPLQVKGSYQTIFVNKSTAGQTQFLKSVAGRIAGSHLKRDFFNFPNETPYQKSAMDYAEKNWGEILVPDNWLIYFELEINPSHFIGVEKTVFAAFTTSRNYWDDLENDDSGPKSLLINDSIMQATTSIFVANELRGGRRSLPYTMRQHRTGIGIRVPFPAKISDLLISEGYQFKEDPAIWRKREADKFEEKCNLNNY